MESSTGDNESFNVNSGYWLLAQLMDDILVDIYSASKKVHTSLLCMFYVIEAKC